MDPKITTSIVDDVLSPDVATPTIAETARSLEIISAGMRRRQQHDNEVALKGLFVDWAFNKLNLNRYR